MATPPDDRGWPLEEAARIFATRSLRRLAAAPIAEPDRPARAPDQEIGWKDLEAEGRALLDNWAARSRPINALRESLLERLRQGRLVATGYPVHRDTAYEAVPVEAFLFQNKYVDWTRSRCKGEGRHYQLVCVRRPTSHDAGQSRPPSPLRVKQSVGRPNVRDIITELALEILDDPHGPVWSRPADLREPIRSLGMRKYPRKFKSDKPKKEVFRIGINAALLQRPHLSKRQ